MALAAVAAGTGLLAAPEPAQALAQWREAVGAARRLAENDAPSAFAAAARLQAGIPAGAGDADRALSLNTLARCEVYLARTESAAEHSREAHELGRRSGDRVGQAEADLNLAINAVNQGDIPLLIESTTDCMAVLQGVDRPDLLGEALLRTAMMYRRLGKIDESVAMCVRAMEVARQTGDPFAQTYAHQGLGISYYQSDHRPEALEEYRLMRESARAAHSLLLEGDATAEIAAVSTDLGELRAGEGLYREAIADYHRADAPFSIDHGLFGLANNLQLQGRRAEALSLFSEVRADYKRHPNRIGLWYTLNAISSGREALGDAGGALDAADEAYSVAKAIGFPLYIGQSARRIAAIVAARGDYKRAYGLELEADDMDAQAARKTISARVIELAHQYEVEDKQREIDALKLKNERQAAELRQRALEQRELWTLLGGGAAVLAIAVFTALRLRHSERQIKAARDALSSANLMLEERVRQRTSELEASNRELEAFSYSVSHDLRAPLRSINGFSEMLLEDYSARLEPAAVDIVQTIRTASVRMGQLIDHLLKLARVTRAELRRSEVDLSALAAAIGAEFRADHPDRPVALEVQPGLVVSADPVLMRVALENLLGNAWKFTARREAARVEVGKTEAAPGPAFFVRDNGAGFDSRYGHKLFKPFQRLHSPEEFQGTGVGLATVQRIIRRHGGVVWAEGETGRGATFYFTVPP